jgi:hypothetical protein
MMPWPLMGAYLKMAASKKEYSGKNEGQVLPESHKTRPEPPPIIRTHKVTSDTHPSLSPNI